jgi:hypothetical protein
MPGVYAEELGPAGSGTVEAEQEPNRRGLACPVRAEVAEYLALLHLEIELVEGASVSVELRQADGLDRRSAHFDNVTRPAVSPLAGGRRAQSTA